jgi:hypothetical protein
MAATGSSYLQHSDAHMKLLCKYMEDCKVMPLEKGKEVVAIAKFLQSIDIEIDGDKADYGKKVNKIDPFKTESTIHLDAKKKN